MVPLPTQPAAPRQSAPRVAAAYTGALVDASLQDDLQLHSAFRKLAFYCTIALVFLHFTRLHEVLSFYTSVNTRILYVFSVPALAGFVICGAIRRAFSGRPTIYWTAFVVWMLLSVPFSVWKGSSATLVFSYIRAEYIMLLFLAGLPMTWKECRILGLTIGVAGIVNVGVAFQFSKEFNGRLGTEFATLGNPTDYAGQMLMVLPMVIYLILSVQHLKILVRIVASAAVAYGLYRVVASGSRGGVIALGIALLYAFVTASGRRKLIVAGAVAAGCVAMVPLISKATLDRLTNYSVEYDPTTDAEQSAWTRQQLLKESVQAAISHPVFGVGPGEFADYEGLLHQDRTERAVRYTNAHNSYTQIAADNGIPGFLFYVGGTISAFLMLRRVWKRAQAAGRTEIADLCYFLSVGWVGFGVAIFFINFGYFVYLPALTGLVIALKLAVDRELRELAPAAAAAVPAPAVQVTGAQQIPVAPAPLPAAPQRNRYRFNRPR